MKISVFTIIFIGIISNCYAQDTEKILFDSAFQETDISVSNIKLQEALNTFPQSVYAPQAMWLIAENEYLKGSYQEAQKEFEKYLEKYPRDKNAGFAWARIGCCFLSQEKYDDASQAFRRSLWLDSWSQTSDFARKGAADVLFAQGNFKQALTEYKKISGSEILGANILYKIALCWFNIKNSKEFVRAKQEVFNKYPLSLEASLLKKIDIGKIEQDVFTETPPTARPNDKGDTAAGKKWGIQVGSFTKDENARNLSRTLSRKKYLSWVEQVKIGDGIFYRVYLGKFGTEEEARKKAEEIKIKEDLPTRVTEIDQ